jgi:hypothetical protein
VKHLCNALYVSLVIMLVACSQSTHFSNKLPPSSTKNPPLYPNAQQVKVQSGGTAMGTPDQITSFYTSALPDAVVSFYKDALLQDGWEVTLNAATSNITYFEWIGATPRISTYRLDLVITRTSTTTLVELRLFEYKPM